MVERGMEEHTSWRKHDPVLVTIQQMPSFCTTVYCTDQVTFSIWKGAMDNSLSLGADQFVKFQQAVTTATVISSSKFAELPTALATVPEPRFTGNRVTR